MWTPFCFLALIMQVWNSQFHLKVGLFICVWLLKQITSTRKHSTNKRGMSGVGSTNWDNLIHPSSGRMFLSNAKYFHPGHLHKLSHFSSNTALVVFYMTRSSSICPEASNTFPFPPMIEWSDARFFSLIIHKLTRESFRMSNFPKGSGKLFLALYSKAKSYWKCVIVS